MAITDLIDIPPDLNPGLSSAKQATMLSILGNPRSQYNDECQDVENPALLRLIVLESVGPFRVRGLAPAVADLRRIMADVGAGFAEVHAALSTAGMLCARLVRGSTQSISNHSWGTAVDLKLNGVLDRRGDGRVQRGLAQIAPIFNQHGWFWGAGFRTEDAMHFEAGDELIRRWSRNGLLGPAAEAPAVVLTVGDRGDDVRALQQRLNELGAALEVDGVFGTNTKVAVMAFQAARSLSASGAVGSETRTALGLT